ncbi:MULTISPECIES: TIGR02444 family protein [Kordiimonas]|jgi:uncharacterized protein (TIGR02444 family)|uniref:TIGR02444 family protein n=1 Tax=Kordiimonas TaxID=288021 RepID=UPI00257ADA7E|nr:TIGR02444 family protein [Kordiimonas sp. UBA4487]
MTNADIEAQQSTRWPSPDDFWDFTCRTYSHASMQEACLDAQDSLGADVNLLLLCLWMDDHGVRPVADDWDLLMEAASWWQEEKLAPLRMARRALKGQDGYEDAKAEELEAEQQEQRALLKCLTKPPLKSSHARDVWPCVSSYLQICGAKLKAPNMPA